MPFNRFYANSPLVLDNCITVDGSEWIHMRRVMRLRKGDSVEVVNGKGFLANAIVEEILKNGATLCIKNVEHKEIPKPEIIVVQAITKQSNLEWIIEKGTELGAHAFYLFPGERSEKKTINSHQKSRLDQIAIAALKQCGRLYLPTIEINELASLGGTVLFGDLRENSPKITELTIQSPIYFLNGPEKGFSSNEIKFFETKLQAKGVRLSPNVLRTETAAIAAVGLIQMTKT